MDVEEDPQMWESAKQFYRDEVHNEKRTSFWHEICTSLDFLSDVLREGSYIDMGISVNVTVEDNRNHRKRHHRVQILNRVEMEMEKYKEN